jgi:3-methyladenine DNA glycosylase AlkD
MNTKQLLKEIQECLRKNASPEALAAQLKFVPGAEKQKAYGVRLPVINQLAKDYKAGGFDLVEALWTAGSLEEKMLAAKMMAFCAKKEPTRALKLLESFSVDIADWAVCDTLGMQSLKPIVKTHQKEIFALSKKLNKSKNFWQRRLSLVLNGTPECRNCTRK